jgi:phenylpyruvate tautomerase PptA (4-oxalocrotonate tautomerase family)
MPVYQCFVQEGSITEPIRAEVASEITRLQVEATDAPRQFVNVVFFDIPRGHMFTAAAPSPNSIISGTIRAGRTLEVRQQLLKGPVADVDQGHGAARAGVDCRTDGHRRKLGHGSWLDLPAARPRGGVARTEPRQACDARRPVTASHFPRGGRLKPPGGRPACTRRPLNASPTSAHAADNVRLPRSRNETY